MNSLQSKFTRLLTILLVVLIPVSCSQDPLPEVPAFEALGFEDALDDVRQQMLLAYERWQVEPQSVERNGRLGMLLSAYGKNSASEVFYRRARILAPDEFRWIYYHAVAAQQLGRYEDAAALFREALEIDPEHVQTRIYLAGVLLQTNDIEASIELYEAFTTAFPERVVGWLGLGKALDRSGDLAAAVTALKRARSLGSDYGEVHYALASVLSASGDEEGAAREWDAYKNTAKNTIRTSDPLMLEVIRLNASDRPYMTKADYHGARGEFAEAAMSFRAALSINPANQDAWSGLIQAQAKRGNKQEAAAAYEAAIAAGIRYKRLHFTYGDALRKWKQFDAARDVISKAIELDPSYTEALLAMGELELQRGAHATAVEHFRRATMVVPNDRTARFSLAQALNAAGQFEEAVTQLETLTTDPALDAAKTLKELAVAYHGMKRIDEAIDTLTRSRVAARKQSRTTMVESIDALLAEWYPGSTRKSP